MVLQQIGAHQHRKKDSNDHFHQEVNTCLKRIINDNNRPLAALGEDKLAQIYKERLKTYEIFEPYSFCSAE